MNASFHELEPYYSGGVFGPSLHGDSYNKENGLQEGGGGDKFIELEEMNERFGKSVQQGYASIPEIESELLEQLENKLGVSDMTESSMPSELPMSTPLTEESRMFFPRKFQIPLLISLMKHMFLKNI